MKQLLVIVLSAITTNAIACEAALDDDMIEPTEIALFLKVAEKHAQSFLETIRQFAKEKQLTRTFIEEEETGGGAFSAGFATPFEGIQRGARVRGIYVHHNVETQCIRVLMRVWDDCQTREAETLRAEIQGRVREKFNAERFPQISRDMRGITL